MSASSTETLILDLNKKGIEYISVGRYSKGYEMLKKAESILNSKETPNRTKLLGITINNLGCYYKRLENFTPALECFSRSLEVSSSNLIDASGVHLNISSILSRQGKHEEALSSALYAYQLICQSTEPNIEKAPAYAVACYNIGEEYRILRKDREAYMFFKKGYKFACRFLGNTSITKTLQESLLRTKQTRNHVQDIRKSYEKIVKELHEEISNAAKAVPVRKKSNSIQAIKPILKRKPNTFKSRKIIVPPHRSSRKITQIFSKENFKNFEPTPIKPKSPLTSIKKIQRFVRASIARKKAQKRKKSVLKIQAWFRTIDIKDLFLSIRDAAVTIQRYYRKKRNIKTSSVQQIAEVYEHKKSSACLLL